MVMHVLRFFPLVCLLFLRCCVRKAECVEQTGADVGGQAQTSVFCRGDRPRRTSEEAAALAQELGGLAPQGYTETPTGTSTSFSSVSVLFYKRSVSYSSVINYLVILQRECVVLQCECVVFRCQLYSSVSVIFQCECVVRQCEHVVFWCECVVF